MCGGSLGWLAVRGGGWRFVGVCGGSWGWVMVRGVDVKRKINHNCEIWISN